MRPVWEPVKKVMAEAFLERKLKMTEEARLKDAKVGLKLENLEVVDTATKTTLDVQVEYEKTLEPVEPAVKEDTKTLEVTR